MANYNSNIHAVVNVVFEKGTQNPTIAIDPTSKLPVSFNVASVERKKLSPIGVYIVTLIDPISAITMRHECLVCCDSAPRWCSVHPKIIDGLVSTIEIRGFTALGLPADIMFTLEITNQWMS